MRTLHFPVHRGGVRLDKFVSLKLPELSRTRVQKLIARGLVMANNKSAKPSLMLEAGDEVDVTLPPLAHKAPAPEDISVSIVYEDHDLVVVDKPAGLVVHPAPGHPEHTLVNAILAHCNILPDGDSLRPGIVHRLDKDTSGLMVIAKNARVKANLQGQFKNHSVARHYLALACGHISSMKGKIEAPIGRHPLSRKRMAIISEGKEAETLYQVIEYLANYTLLDVAPITGRTHQIRVHLSAIGYPVAGDAVYGARSPFLSRQFVHACLLGLRLPSSGKYTEFKSELPLELKQALDSIRLDRPSFG